MANKTETTCSITLLCCHWFLLTLSTIFSLLVMFGLTLLLAYNPIQGEIYNSYNKLVIIPTSTIAMSLAFIPPAILFWILILFVYEPCFSKSSSGDGGACGAGWMLFGCYSLAYFVPLVILSYFIPFTLSVRVNISTMKIAEGITSVYDIPNLYDSGNYSVYHLTNYKVLVGQHGASNVISCGTGCEERYYIAPVVAKNYVDGTEIIVFKAAAPQLSDLSANDDYLMDISQVPKVSNISLYEAFEDLKKKHPSLTLTDDPIFLWSDNLQSTMKTNQVEFTVMMILVAVVLLLRIPELIYVLVASGCLITFSVLDKSKDSGYLSVIMSD